MYEFYQIKKKDIILILVGTFFMAASINFAYDPMNMVTGGVTGLGIAVEDLTKRFFNFGPPVWMTNLICNIPLFLFAYRILGKNALGKTLFAAIALTIFLYLLPIKSMVGEDYLLASVFGGVIGGAGIGFVLSAMATTGGTDLLCMLIHEKKKYYSVPRLLSIVDGIVVLMGVFVFGINRALYAVIAVYITSKVSDGMLEGMKFAKMTYIISDYAKEIADEILQKIGRGVTGLNAEGMYSNSEKKMLLCVVGKKEIVEVIQIINQIDPKAFVIVSDIREVMGEGFIEIKQ